MGQVRRPPGPLASGSFLPPESRPIRHLSSMNWTDTRKKLLQLASSRVPRLGGDALPLEIASPAESGRARAVSLCIASGKGGTGKSIVTASLAALLSPRGKTLIVDADFGVGN